MGEEFTARTFKSGNSVALRLPKGLGVKEGQAMRVREEHGHFVFAPVDQPKRKFNIAKVSGSAMNLLPIDGDRRFRERALDWRLPGDHDAAEQP